MPRKGEESEEIARCGEKPHRAFSIFKSDAGERPKKGSRTDGGLRGKTRDDTSDRR
nr:MAG TPA: hypothetical protein [Caudoviricetes sp.]